MSGALFLLPTARASYRRAMQAQVVTCACGDYRIERHPLTRDLTTWRVTLKWRRPNGTWVFVGEYRDVSEAADVVTADGHGPDGCT